MANGDEVFLQVPLYGLAPQTVLIVDEKITFYGIYRAMIALVELPPLTAIFARSKTDALKTVAAGTPPLASVAVVTSLPHVQRLVREVRAHAGMVPIIGIKTSIKNDRCFIKGREDLYLSARPRLVLNIRNLLRIRMLIKAPCATGAAP